MYMQTQTQPK